MDAGESRRGRVGRLRGERLTILVAEASQTLRVLQLTDLVDLLPLVRTAAEPAPAS